MKQVLTLLLLIPLLVPSSIFAQEEAEKVFQEVDQMPRFPGCEAMKGTQEEKKACAEKKMLEFIYLNIKYPEEARINRSEGMVVISFIVEKDGSISNPKILRNVAHGCGEESLRVIKSMPKLIPGKEDGEIVRFQFNLPVRFKLQSPQKSKKRNSKRG